MSDQVKVIKGAIGIAILVIICSFWGGNKYQQWNSAQNNVQLLEEVEETDQEIAVESEPMTIYVHVAGAVQNSGVYQLLEGQRVEDALSLAGVLPEALVDEYLNRAAILQDGQKIIVPSIDDPLLEQPLPVMGNVVGMNNHQLININQADQSTLETLAGIGPAKAEAIIDYRESNGGFKKIDELKEVKGVGDKTFDGLKEDITV